MKLALYFVVVCLWLTTDSANAQIPSWQTDIEILASDQMEGRYTGSKGSQRSREYIINRFKSIGVEPLHSLTAYEQPFTASKEERTINGTNVVGQLDGKQHRYVVVSAHYDHLGRKGRRIFNGADDNASGVAAMLYLAEQSAARERQCHQVFLASDAEEHGLLGARAFVKSGKLPLDITFVNLNLDMLSQPGGRKEILVSGNASHSKFNDLIASIELITSMPMTPTDEKRRVGRYPNVSDRRKVSDHAAFAEQGIPFLFLGVGRHTYYHTPRDTTSRINMDFYGETVSAALQYLFKLDELCGAEQE